MDSKRTKRLPMRLFVRPLPTPCMPADYNEETFQIRRKILPIGTAETMENTTTDQTMQANHAGCSAEII